MKSERATPLQRLLVREEWPRPCAGSAIRRTRTRTRTRTQASLLFFLPEVTASGTLMQLFGGGTERERRENFYHRPSSCLPLRYGSLRGEVRSSVKRRIAATGQQCQGSVPFHP